MALSNAGADKINEALQAWRQGDVSLDAGLEFLHLGDLSRPHSSASQQTAKSFVDAAEEVPSGAIPLLDEILGLVVLSQTCDVVRDCRERPFVEVAPIVRLSEGVIEEVRRQKRAAFAYIPSLASQNMAVDLDRVMTVEKALVSDWTRVPGWEADHDIRTFAKAIGRKHVRFAFPDDFVAAARKLQARLTAKHSKDSDEGKYLRALSEIRVRAAPAWDAEAVQINWWFIKNEDPLELKELSWSAQVQQWVDLFERGGRFSDEVPIVCRLQDMTALDYIESDSLELDHLSVAR